MKKPLLFLAVICALGLVPARAADSVGTRVARGDPDYYGQLDIGDKGRPAVIHSQPVIVEHRYPNLAPIYLRVPPGHAKNWSRYCDRYNACTRPVYFVREDWYRNQYMQGQGHEQHDSHVKAGRDDRHDNGKDGH